MSPVVFILGAAVLAEPPAAPVSEARPVQAASVQAASVQATSVQATAVAAASLQASPVRPSSGPVRLVDAHAEAGPLRDDLEVVDAGSEDVGALGTSLRHSAHDARLPTAGQRVYRVPGDDGKLMRGNGALFAVFPESVYRRTARGTVAVAPPGTVFHIGMPGELHLAPEKPKERVLAPGQIDGRVSARVPPDASLGVHRIGGRLTAPSDATTERAADPQPPAPTPFVEAAPLGPQDPYAHLGFGPSRVERD